MNEWNIQSRAHACQACGKGFADKQQYHTLLFDEKRDFIRLDVCDTCWLAQYSQGANDRKGFISYWQGVYEAPPGAPPDPIKREAAETLLRKLIALNDPKFMAVSFILAVMLERKRSLKVIEQLVQEGRRVFVYEQPKTGDVFTIPDPHLQLNQLDQVQHDVADLLEHGLPEPAPVTPAVPAPLPEAGSPIQTQAPADHAVSQAEPVSAAETAPPPAATD